MSPFYTSPAAQRFPGFNESLHDQVLGWPVAAESMQKVVLKADIAVFAI